MNEFRVSAIGISFILFATFVSWSLAHAARRMPEGIPRSAKIAVCGTVFQLAFLVGGFLIFENMSFVDWLRTRSARGYFLYSFLFLLGCLAAWSVLRERRINIGVFE